MAGLAVKVYNNNIEIALKKLKRKIKNSGMMKKLYEKEYFIKPSTKRRERKNLAILRAKYNQEKEKK